MQNHKARKDDGWEADRRWLRRYDCAAERRPEGHPGFDPFPPGRLLLPGGTRPRATKVLRAWPGKTEATEVDPATIAEYVRRSLSLYLEDDFQEFIGDAAPEDRHLFHEIMTTWRSNTSAGLANAFENEIRRNRQYVFVPRHNLIDEVKHFVEVLMDGPTKAA
jgi:hypothetical protein